MKFSYLSRLRGVTVLLLCGLMITACSGNSFTAGATPTSSTPGAPAVVQPAPTDPSNGLVARVNGQPITAEAYRRELARWQAGQAALGYQVADQAAFEQQVLDLMIEDELIRQYTVQQGLSVTEAEVDEVINGMIADTSQEHLDNWLASNYYTLDEFREEIRFDLLAKKATEPIIASVPTIAEHVHARHILVNTEQQANEVMARLQAGEDFAALAAEYSVDRTTQGNGGDLSWFARGGLTVPEVEEAAFSLQPGQISPIIVSAMGYHIIQVLEFDPARTLDEETRQRLIQRTLREWADSLREGAQIEQFLNLSS